MNKNESLSYVRYISLVIIAATLFLFPIFFLTNTTEIFLFPKQVLVTFASLALLVLFAVRTVLEGKITIKSSPFNLPAMLFGIVVVASSLFSANMYDSLLQSLPVLMLLFLYFSVMNTIEDKSSWRIAIFALLAGAGVSSLITVVHFLKLYIFPFAVTQNQYFNTYGSSVQQLLYMAPLLVLSLYYLIKQSKKASVDYAFGFYAFSAVTMAIGAVVIIFQIITLPQKPIILPFIYGFQIALSTLSQEANRLIQTFLFGSGYGTFGSDFTRFKPVTFNGEQDLWSLVFSYSSTYFLELIATAGVLGALSYLFLVLKVIKTRTAKTAGIYIAIVIAFLLSFVLPFSYVTLFGLFMLLALYASHLYVAKHPSVYEFTLSLIAWKQSLMNFSVPSDDMQHEPQARIEKKESRYLPYAFTLLIVLFAGFIGYYGVKLIMAENMFRNSLSQESLQSGQETYELQRDAIQTFPYKSDYYRVFSQINLALANSLLSNLPENSSPSAQTQSTVLQLLQQSINSGRAAAQLSPTTNANWVQLSSVYRNLIGVGQNAENFSVASLQQAIALDPYNPNLYIQLGGIYYQLGLYEQAQNQFQVAVNLKPDLANARYNLGHALEAKGDLQNAFTQYQIVAQLVNDNPENKKQIEAEIEALKKKAGELAQKQTETTDEKAADASTPLQTPGEEAKLPARPEDQKIQLTPPPATITPTRAVSPTTTPAEEEVTPTP
jgi:tetratricopeptide (TPR) repeat protein